MILVDTNIVSELMRAEPAPQVLRWLDAQPAEVLTLSAITVAELVFGLEQLPQGHRRSQLQNALLEQIELNFPDKVLAFDHAAAFRYGRLAADLRRRGISIGQSDAIIAAIALHHDATLATRNVRHFEPCGVRVVNPFDTGTA